MNFRTGIIGFGKLGSNLSIELHKIKLLSWIIDISENARNDAKSIFGSIPVYSQLSEVESISDIIIITTSDSEIKNVADSLSSFFNKKIDSKIILHCSGSLGIDVLESCSKCGALIGSAHPYQTFYSSSDLLFDGIPWGIQSDTCSGEISELIKKIKGKPYIFNEKTSRNKLLYHISAVASSNFVNSTLALAGQIAELADIPKTEFIPPIAYTTLYNASKAYEEGTFPLTGPIARGDLNTILKHIESLNNFPPLKNAYIYFTLATLEIAFSNKIIQKQKFVEFKSFLLNLL